MRISTLTLLAGCLAAAPLLAKTAPKAAHHKASSAARSTTKSAAKKASSLAHKGTRPAHAAKPASSARSQAAPEKLVPTVSFNSHNSVKPAADKPDAAVAAQPGGHLKDQLRPAGTSDPAPGVPVDFGSASEAKAYQSDIDGSLTDIQNLLDRAYSRKPGKPKAGIAGVMALQPQIDKALNDGQVSDEDQQTLKTLLAQRDTALYMLSASLVAQKKDAQAASYLRFLAKSASPGTPMRDAAVQQLAQIGLTP